MSGELVSKEVLRRSASSRESRCAFARKFSVNVALIYVSEEDVGDGINGIGVSGLRGSPKSNSLGVVQVISSHSIDGVLHLGDLASFQGLNWL